jgi:hypothetical protein
MTHFGARGSLHLPDARARLQTFGMRRAMAAMFLTH